ncbi:unnamed protein product [Lampetra planeri]
MFSGWIEGPSRRSDLPGVFHPPAVPDFVLGAELPRVRSPVATSNNNDDDDDDDATCQRPSQLGHRGTGAGLERAPGLRLEASC